MNITELDSFNLADAVKFHNRLNPRLWDKAEHLHPKVRDKLLEIAADFQEFLGVADLDVVDITVSGSNAAYSYTPHSDIDLHLVVKNPNGSGEVYQELFNAKKYQYNDMHDIRIHGADVELYVQSADESPVSLGEYSVRDNKWLQVPRRKRAKIDHNVVKHKYEDVKARIESAVKDNHSERIYALIKKIKEMRQTGLDQHGEFGPENLAYKMLRSQGYIDRLYTAHASAKDRELSLKEKAQPISKPGEWWKLGEDNTGMAQGSSIGDAGAQSTWDGVSPDTDEFLSEDDIKQSVLRDFIRDTVKVIGIKKMPTIHVHNSPEWSEQTHSFGRYVPETHDLHINMWNRHIMDVLRTTAHELAHCKQHEVNALPANAGDTGSKWENQAHAVAGVIMRKWADKHPDLFEASGYIPTNAEKNDPRFVMALSQDVRPGATGLNANKMSLKTNAQGKPSLIMKTANLRESRMPQPSQGPGRYRELNEPLGPETPPTMPAGTIKVDVSDVYDWYKLGQHISNMKGLGKHDFGQGAPSAILSFGDEETEHKYIKDLEATGLTTTDIDPKDPKQPKGMPRQKTDSTYNVDEDDIIESLHQEFALLEDEYLSEIKMTPGNLRQLAAQTGAQAGMEFEMIVPDVGMDDSEPDYEADYDQDTRTRSFQDIRSFFHDGDYNGRRAVDDLMEEIDNEYLEWQQEQIDKAWAQDGLSFMQDYISLNDLFDRDEAMQEARDEIIAANPDLLDQSPDEFDKLISVRVDEMEQDFAAQEFENQGRIYNDAFGEFSDEQRDEYDERSFLDEQYPRMTDIENGFDITWPYYTDMNVDSGGADIDQVADEFSSYMGKPVNASKQYHGGRREAGTYVVEPDGSLEGDNPGDEGLEFVSPPMPIDEMISDLNKVKAWAGEQGCYTNESTGLHINISVPNYSIEKLDYVKLALLMGDEYVLELFDRSGNTYAKSAIGKIKGMLQKNPDVAPKVMNKMREHMEDLATKAIHSGITDKYTSINTKTGYIEFRSPGGDWLDSNFDKIENTLLRFTVALSAAIDPAAYRQEYLKKLYKLLEGSQEKGGPDILQLFANYSAGELDKAALIRQVREKQLARDVAKGKAPAGQQYWWNVQWDANRRMEVVASNKNLARQVAAEEWGVPVEQLAIAKVTVLRPYEPPEVKPAAEPRTGNWGIWINNADRFANRPGEYLRSETPPLIRFPTRAAAEQWIEQQRAERPNMRTDIEVREIEPSQPIPGSTLDLQRQRADPYRYVPIPGVTDIELDIPLAQQSTDAAQGGTVDVATDQAPRTLTRPGQGQQTFTGTWLVLDPQDREIYRFSGVGNSQSDANRVAMNWMRQHPGAMQAGVTVVPEMQ